MPNPSARARRVSTCSSLAPPRLNRTHRCRPATEGRCSNASPKWRVSPADSRVCRCLATLDWLNGYVGAVKTQHLKFVLLVLAVAGVAIPYAAFLPFVAEHGLDVPLLVEQAAANRISAFAWLDVVVSAAVLLVAAYSGRFIPWKKALFVTVLTLCAGVSAGLPLFLYFALDAPAFTKH